EPAAQELEQPLAHGSEIGRMHGADAGGLRRRVHDVVEAVDELSHRLGAAELRVGRFADLAADIVRAHAVDAGARSLAERVRETTYSSLSPRWERGENAGKNAAQK